MARSEATTPSRARGSDLGYGGVTVTVYLVVTVTGYFTQGPGLPRPQVGARNDGAWVGLWCLENDCRNFKTSP
ncbi:hypothetical protein [Magnetovibrio blakemorei]|uniref:hypothetical protein n=1 Tax=Magnetovibrio blakemorei TaxID=28181 RepID=UPI001112E870|nr:hypothetical protein [Magnetovibrio blakemorei]